MHEVFLSKVFFFYFKIRVSNSHLFQANTAIKCRSKKKKPHLYLQGAVRHKMAPRESNATSTRSFHRPSQDLARTLLVLQRDWTDEINFKTFWQGWTRLMDIQRFPSDIQDDLFVIFSYFISKRWVWLALRFIYRCAFVPHCCEWISL